MIDGTTSELMLVDPYIDQSVFYRYLYRLPKETKIKIITDKDKLKGTRLKAFESVEVRGYCGYWLLWLLVAIGVAIGWLLGWLLGSDLSFCFSLDGRSIAC